MSIPSFDPWTQIKTRHGYAADEVISAVQKCIRRAESDLAVRFALEMYLTSEEMEHYLWKRLSAISVEDIGPGNPMMPVLIDSLDRLRMKFAYGAGDRALFIVHAVRQLCQSEKSRSNDLTYNIVVRELNAGKGPEIPEFALDMHTQRGKAMGRDLQHFLTEASKIVPAAPQDEALSQALSRLLSEPKA